MVQNSFELTNKLIIHDRKEFLSYLRKNKLTKEKLLINHFQKKDLYSGESIHFKNEEQYLNQDFNSRENLNNFLLSLDRLSAKKYIVEFLKKRKERKGLIFAPSQIEMKSYIAPSINIIQKGLGLDYNQIVQESELLPRFSYKGNFKINDLGELKVIYDSREQKPLRFNNLKKQTLNFADYTCLEPYFSNVFIERKSLSDLLGTLSPKNIERFKNELARAVELKSYLIVVIEDSFNNLLRMKDLKHIHSQATPEYILHKLRSIMEISNSIQFVFVNNRRESVRVIEKIFRLKEQVKELDLEYLYGIGKL